MTCLRAVGRFYGRYAQFGGRAGRAAATETVRAALAGLVAELDELRSTT